MDGLEFFIWVINWRHDLTKQILECNRQQVPIPIEAQALLSQALAIVEKAALNKELNSDAK